MHEVIKEMIITTCRPTRWLKTESLICFTAATLEVSTRSALGHKSTLSHS